MANKSNTPTTLSIPDAAKFLGIQDFHMRELLRKGKIKAVKEPIPGKEKTLRWAIPQAALDAYKANRKSVGKRNDGRNKYTLYLNDAELDAFKKAFPKALLTRANPTKEATPTK